VIQEKWTYELHATIHRDGYWQAEVRTESGELIGVAYSSNGGYDAVTRAAMFSIAPDMARVLSEVNEWFSDHGPPLGESQEAHKERVLRAAIHTALKKAGIQ
jgi:hypothetical protein